MKDSDEVVGRVTGGLSEEALEGVVTVVRVRITDRRSERVKDGRSSEEAVDPRLLEMGV